MNDEIIQIDGKFYKKHKVVMLATEDKLAPLAIEGKYLYNYPVIQTSNYQHLYILSDEKINKNDWCIMIDDFGNTFSSKPQQWLGIGKLNSGIKKIVATTDSLLFIDHRDYSKDNISYSTYRKLLSRPSESFIQKFVSEYNKGNIIKEILVEYEEVLGDAGIIAATFGENDYKLKIAPDNTITIKPVIETWDNILENYWKTFKKNSKNILELDFKNWLADNYNIPIKK